MFPTVISLLGHVLLTIGSGYDINDQGMPAIRLNIGINEYPDMTMAMWKALFADCYLKELGYVEDRWLFEDDLGKAATPDEYTNELIVACGTYRVVSVDDSMFTEDALYQELHSMKADLRYQHHSMLSMHGCGHVHFSEERSPIYKLNTATPVWFLEICINFVNACVRFLSDQITSNDVGAEEDDECEYHALTATTNRRNQLRTISINLRNLINDRQ